MKSVLTRMSERYSGLHDLHFDYSSRINKFDLNLLFKNRLSVFIGIYKLKNEVFLPITLCQSSVNS